VGVGSTDKKVDSMVLSKYTKTFSLKTTKDRRPQKRLKYVKNGDVIHMSYLPSEGELLFSSNRGNSHLHGVEGDNLVPYVMLQHEDDAVELII